MRTSLAIVVAAVSGLLAACTGPAGTDGTGGTSCSVTDNGNGTYTISCTDGTTATVGDGTDGTDGTSCTVTDNGNGTKTVTCDDGTTVTVTDGSNGTSCTITDNGNGTKTIGCADGTSVTVSDGTDGEPGTAVEIPSFHGRDALANQEFAESGKIYATATITAATADATGSVTVDFTVANAAGAPLLTVPAISANIVRLQPPAAGEGSSKWVPYIYRTQTVSGSASGDWPNPDGTAATQAYRESTGTLTNHGDGSYTYAFVNNISLVTVDGTPIVYDRSATHRIAIMMGGGSGITADAFYDFVPDGSTLTQTRDIVQTSNCQSCHGEEFHGHGGDRRKVEVCVTCHTTGSWDPQGGETLDAKVMVHKIHAGAELATTPGADGLVWDDPATPADESADNGVIGTDGVRRTYSIWGYGNSRNEWSRLEFPAVIENCTKCHQGTGPEVDNWKTRPSRAACGACHDDVSFAVGTNHPGGVQADDAACATCHPAVGVGIGGSVTGAHDWTMQDPRNIAEFTASLTLSTPANGTSFEVGEAPVVTLVLTDAATGVPLDHTTVLEDATGEGCVPSGVPLACPPRDGLFRVASLFVHGPRALRVPVLTTAARAQVLSATTGPWDLSAAGASLIVKLDQGQNVIRFDTSGGDYTAAALVTVPVSAAAFASTAAATTDEVVAWLNANTAFARRAIAYNQAGKVGVRSRNLGRVHALQLQASVVTTQLFAGDVTVHLPTGSTTANNISQRTVAANNDPKASRTAASITYTLDPVDDLEPGTYVAFIEFSDRGRIDATNYVTPTVARVAFQVKTATPELPPANNCDSCHQSPVTNTGFIVDVSRHNKILDHTAVDQCGNCHDYQPQLATGLGWSGARPIAKRVHAVHMGANLMYPLTTVDYGNGDPVKGRNWQIDFPQDVRNCETCHEDGETSGTWATKAARLPCMGCHDADAATAHMRIMTWDPTPADAWSGDEEESCMACH